MTEIKHENQLHPIVHDVGFVTKVYYNRKPHNNLFERFLQLLSGVKSGFWIKRSLQAIKRAIFQ